MLIKLTGPQVADYWADVLKDAIESSLPEIVTLNESTMNNVLTAILTEVIECWMVRYKDEEDLLGVCTTMITTDPVSQSKALLIYSLHSFETFPDELWFENLELLKRYAKSKGCDVIYCYSDNERIVDKALAVGGSGSQQLLTFTCTE